MYSQSEVQGEYKKMKVGGEEVATECVLKPEIMQVPISHPES